MTDINPAEVKAAHRAMTMGGKPWCTECGAVETPCEAWKLADALENVRAEVIQLRAELERIAGHTRDAYDQRDAAQAALEVAEKDRDSWRDALVRRSQPKWLCPVLGCPQPTHGPHTHAASSDPYERSADA
jgi:hypothetical protein